MTDATALEPSDAPAGHDRRAFDSFDLPDEVRDGGHPRRRASRTARRSRRRRCRSSLAGSDVAGQAQTGTGKTAAFLITALHAAARAAARREAPAAPRALVIAPTRELVVQIANDARLLGQATPFTIHAVFGGVDYKKQRDERARPASTC